MSLNKNRLYNKRTNYCPGAIDKYRYKKEKRKKIEITGKSTPFKNKLRNYLPAFYGGLTRNWKKGKLNNRILNKRDPVKSTIECDT
jgi:hypothetical protein